MTDRKVVNKTIPKDVVPNPETWKKRCTKCNRLLPLKAFHREKRHNDGRKSWCKDCFRAYRMEWHYSRRERDKERERLRKQARQRAYQRLARLEPNKFVMLFQQELYKMGFDYNQIKRTIDACEGVPEDSQSQEEEIYEGM